jgi:hypothetical protein
MARQRNVWGSVRKLPSGRYQARYTVNGRSHAAPTTFATKPAADAYLAGVRADLGRGRWIDRAAAAVPMRTYAERWLAEHPGLRPSTPRRDPTACSSADGRASRSVGGTSPWPGTVPAGRGSPTPALPRPARGQHPRRGHRCQHEGADGEEGHASPRAALICQHALRDRDHAIAQALDDMITATRPPEAEHRRGA